MVEEENYRIVVTSPAQTRYQKTILTYLIKHFSLERAYEIDNAITNKLDLLKLNPGRGALEKYLMGLEKEFRFILHKETRNFEIKIIYFVQEENKTVFVTDFFPSMMNPKKMHNWI